MLLTILGFLCGIVLSARFDFLILLPGILVGWLLTVTGGLISGSTAVSIVLGMVMVATALQGGYMLGIVGQWALRSHRFVHRSTQQRWPGKTAAAPDSAV